MHGIATSLSLRSVQAQLRTPRNDTFFIFTEQYKKTTHPPYLVIL